MNGKNISFVLLLVGQMDFRKALLFFEMQQPISTLTAREMSDVLSANLRGSDTTQRELLRMFSTKRISGDLDRLYRMGLVRRKRVRRRVISRRGIPVFRGFEYRYVISKQGSQYVKYITKPKVAGKKSILDQIQDGIQERLIEHAHDTMPALHANFLEETLTEVFAGKPFEDRGRHKRFPTEKYRWLFNKLVKCRRDLARKEREIERLKKSVVSLAGGLKRPTA